MIDAIRRLCDQLAAGTDDDPRALAAQIGTIEPTAPGQPITVVPFDRRLGSARVISWQDSGRLNSVVVIPADRPTIAALREALGPCAESPRLPPGSPPKLVFAAPPDQRRHAVRVIAEISADETAAETAAVERLTFTR